MEVASHGRNSRAATEAANESRKSRNSQRTVEITNVDIGEEKVPKQIPESEPVDDRDLQVGSKSFHNKASIQCKIGRE